MLLAFDTATARVSVALHEGAEVVAVHTAGEGMRHGEQLAPAIAAVLAQVGAIPTDVTAVAVGVGPGPFTGLRVGLMTARTMAWALEIPAYGVCTLDILAAEACDVGASEFLVASDARRKEVHWAHYRDGVRLTDPAVDKPGDVPGPLAALPVVGRGALLYPETFPDAARPELPSAAVLADVVAGERFELVDPEPMYLRRPDAMEPRAPKRVS